MYIDDFFIVIEVNAGNEMVKECLGQNQKYQECVPLCQRSCQMPDLSLVLCMAGCEPNLHCVCTDDTVRAWSPDGPCIPLEDCCLFENNENEQ